MNAVMHECEYVGVFIKTIVFKSTSLLARSHEQGSVKLIIPAIPEMVSIAYSCIWTL